MKSVVLYLALYYRLNNVDALKLHLPLQISVLVFEIYIGTSTKHLLCVVVLDEFPVFSKVVDRIYQI